MPAGPTHVQRVLNRWLARKVMTLAQLTDQLGCSSRTVHRRLKGWRAINSYSHNGRYYALPGVPQFDADGLWRFGDIGFSQHGNLTQTIVQLVKHSAAGLSGAELRDRLGVDLRSFLSLFRSHPDVKREAHRGRFVYLCSEAAVYRRQRRQRSLMGAGAKRFSDAEAIAILVAIMKHPDLPLEQLCRQLNRQGVKVHVGAVSNLLAYHGLEQKKTPPSPS